MSTTSGLLVSRANAGPTKGAFAIGDQHLGLAVAQDEGDRFRVEANIERIQHRPRHGCAEMCFEGLREVWRQHRHRVARLDALRRERSGQPPAAFERLAPAVAPAALDHRRAIGVDGRGAQQKADRGQRHGIRGALVEPGLIGIGRSGRVMLDILSLSEPNAKPRFAQPCAASLVPALLAGSSRPLYCLRG